MVVALVGAMHMEIARYCSLADQLIERRSLAVQAWRGQLFSNEVVIAISGIGKIRAALTTQHLIDVYEPDAVVMVGVAGALKESLRIGDVVVSLDCMQHDVEAVALGYLRGELPGGLDQRVLVADPRLVRLALMADRPETPVIPGRLLTGDQFYTEQQTRERSYLIEELEGSAIDMEGAALAAVCAASRVPFVVICAICSELRGSQENQFNDTAERVAGNTVGAVRAILDGWSSHL